VRLIYDIQKQSGLLTGVQVKLLDWIKGAVGLAKAPARPQQDRPPPDAPRQIDDRAPAEVASPDAGEIRPAHPINIKPARPVELAPEGSAGIAPERPISAEPARPDFVQPGGPAGVEADGAPNPEEIDRRRAVVRAFFNDYWSSVEDKPASFAERLDGAEAYINERVEAGGEVWRLDPATRKLLGLPPSRKP
jgi:hypothetical protein